MKSVLEPALRRRLVVRPYGASSLSVVPFSDLIQLKNLAFVSRELSLPCLFFFAVCVCVCLFVFVLDTLSQNFFSLFPQQVTNFHSAFLL